MTHLAKLWSPESNQPQDDNGHDDPRDQLHVKGGDENPVVLGLIKEIYTPGVGVPGRGGSGRERKGANRLSSS